MVKHNLHEYERTVFTSLCRKASDRYRAALRVMGLPVSSNLTNDYKQSPDCIQMGDQ